MEKFTRIGQIVGAFGIRGQVKVDPSTDFLDRFAAGSRLRLNGNWVEVETFAVHKKRPLIKLRGIDTTNQAEALQWQYLETPTERKPDLADDEFLSADLVGLKVVTVEGRELGKVTDVIPMPAHDVIQVGELLIPAVVEFVTDVDLDAGIMTVKLIPGMLPEDGD